MIYCVHFLLICSFVVLLNVSFISPTEYSTSSQWTNCTNILQLMNVLFWNTSAWIGLPPLPDKPTIEVACPCTDQEAKEHTMFELFISKSNFGNCYLTERVEGFGRVLCCYKSCGILQPSLSPNRGFLIPDSNITALNFTVNFPLLWEGHEVCCNGSKDVEAGRGSQCVKRYPNDTATQQCCQFYEHPKADVDPSCANGTGECPSTTTAIVTTTLLTTTVNTTSIITVTNETSQSPPNSSILSTTPESKTTISDTTTQYASTTVQPTRGEGCPICGWFTEKCLFECKCRDTQECCESKHGSCASGCPVGCSGDSCMVCNASQAAIKASIPGLSKTLEEAMLYSSSLKLELYQMLLINFKTILNKISRGSVIIQLQIQEVNELDYFEEAHVKGYFSDRLIDTLNTSELIINKTEGNGLSSSDVAALQQLYIDPSEFEKGRQFLQSLKQTGEKSPDEGLYIGLGISALAVILILGIVCIALLFNTRRLTKRCDRIEAFNRFRQVTTPAPKFAREDAPTLTDTSLEQNNFAIQDESDEFPTPSPSMASAILSEVGHTNRSYRYDNDNYYMPYHEPSTSTPNARVEQIRLSSMANGGHAEGPTYSITTPGENASEQFEITYQNPQPKRKPVSLV